jgi:hypothetical protein
MRRVPLIRRGLFDSRRSSLPSFTFPGAVFIAIVTLLFTASAARAQTYPRLLQGASGLPNGIPDLCATPTIKSVQSGAWNAPSTWSTGQIPASGARVEVSSGHQVTYSVSSSAALHCLDIYGHLKFTTNVSTRLQVGTVIVMSGGHLEIGNAAAPVTASAELIIANVPINTAADPDSFHTGLIGIGRVTMHGTPITPTFVRLGTEPLAGHSTLTLAQPMTGWRVGDEVVIPDTRQLIDLERFANLIEQSERATITAISGTTLTLNRSLSFDHRGARGPNGAIEFLPHVGNVSRNVRIRSEAANGTRGHTLYTQRAAVDLRYVEFRDLGRTRTNQGQIGRYPLHMHHVMGPVNAANTGYQYALVGNSVVDSYLWPMTVHNTHYGLIRDNVVAFGEGAGYVAEDGNESHNEWTHNFGMSIRGDNNPKELNGRAGSVFWWRGFNHIATDNVASSGYHGAQHLAAGAGFDFGWTAASAADTPIPSYRGSDMSSPGSYALVNMQHIAIPRFERNEAYGATGVGLIFWYLGTDGYDYNAAQPETVIRDFTGWHLWESGFFAYPTHRVTFDGFKIRAHPGVPGSMGWWAGDYKARDITIRRPDIKGTRDSGINVSTGSEGYFRIEDGLIQSPAAGIRVPRPDTFGTQATVRPRLVEIRNMRFETWPGMGGDWLVKQWSTTSNQSPTLLDEAFAYGFNGVATDNFKWYYTEQGTQNIAGGLAPCQTMRPGIVGIVCPIGAPPPPLPPAAPTNFRLIP